MERGKLKRVHHVSNISTALKFLEMKKVIIYMETCNLRKWTGLFKILLSQAYSFIIYINL